MINTPLYTAHATSKGGRGGNVKSDDGIVDFNLTVPKSEKMTGVNVKAGNLFK